MKVSAFTYVRNGIAMEYPFIESIKSVLPLVDEFIVVVGDSTDGTRQAVENINDSKIKIIDTIWDEAMRSKGLVFAQQANTGLDNVSKDADWLFHIQADEVIHEKDYDTIQNAMHQYLKDKTVEGFLFKFINFFGDYKHWAPSRRFHQKEIRIIRNNPHYRSYRDSQGFRRFNNPAMYLQEKGYKLKVIHIPATVYHYSYVKNPLTQIKKQIEFGRRYNTSDEWIKGYAEANKAGFDYTNIDFLKVYNESHPAVMQARIKMQNWVFNYDPSKNNMRFKEKVLKLVQDITGKQFFIYKNYKIKSKASF
ncbi:MAG TPA: glycosyltransferase family 2 protein [Chitinophagaceae bacterium]|nr:glycosyltransferase family 2 protein [Chitinophagaceae bacterium]